MDTAGPLWTLKLDGGLVPPRDLIGGKAWSLAQMCAIGLRVPAAFVITTQACAAYLRNNELPAQLRAQIDAAIGWLEEQSNRRFGAGPRPLLVSVRSGASVSMPGMMDTVLNLGINDETEQMLAGECGDPEFARDTHQRFLEMYRKIVLKGDTGAPVPQALRDQLYAAIEAVFRSWNSPRARRYRAHHGISNDLGTAVTVQAMVFGNADERSGTGVLFTRNPATGSAEIYGEYLHRAQGEAIVSGTHTPEPLDGMRTRVGEAMDELLRAARQLEDLHQDVQDIEFTVERGRLYLLQSRSAKRSPQAAVRIAVQMVSEGRIDPDEALCRISPEQVRMLLRPRIAPAVVHSAKVLLRGEAASPGVGVGTVVGSADEAESRGNSGEAVVLSCSTTSPEDLHGLIAAQATITELGGSTSHAAVVARALGKPCVVGCGAGTLQTLLTQTVTVDGNTGTIYADVLPLEIQREAADADLAQLIAWAAERSAIRVETAAPAGVDVIDFDHLARMGEPGGLARALELIPPGSSVRGALFAQDDIAAEAAVRAGVTLIVTSPRLPALLVCMRTQRSGSAQHDTTL